MRRPADAWSTEGVKKVCWRSVATLSVLPTANVRPLALSPGDQCISFDCVQRRISFLLCPIAVVAVLGRGRYALIGGRHVIPRLDWAVASDVAPWQSIAHVEDWLQRSAAS